MHTHYWCVHGNCDPAVATEIVNIPGMTILTRVQIVGTSFFRPGCKCTAFIYSDNKLGAKNSSSTFISVKLDNPQSNEPAYKALCYIGPDGTSNKSKLKIRRTVIFDVHIFDFRKKGR